VLTLAVNGTTVYAGGIFTSIGGQSRGSLAAFDATTGLATPWNPGVDGVEYPYVFALAVNGSTAYVGGTFRTIGGQNRSNLAALDATTGLATAWNPGANDAVRALEVSGTSVFVGGDFDVIAGQNRSRIAAVDATTGLATQWNPVADGEVHTLTVSGSTVYAGGLFYDVGQLGVQGFAALRPDAGAPVVQVLSPNGGSPLLIGSQRQMSWRAADDLAVQSVDLYLSRSGPLGPWELLAAAAPNTGSYLWTVSGPEVAGNNAYLLVNARDYSGNLGTDISNSGFSISSTAAGVGSGVGDTPFALSSPAPNPAVNRTLVAFALPTSTHLRLTVNDVQGREVAVVVDGVRGPGRYTAALDAGQLRAGMYFVSLRAQGVSLTKRLAIVR